LGGKLDKPIPVSETDIGVLFSEKYKPTLFTGQLSEVPIVESVKFRIDKTGLLSPFKETLGNIELIYPESYKPYTVTLGIPEAKWGTVDHFVQAPVSFKSTLLLEDLGKSYASIVEEKALSPLEIITSSEDKFNVWYERKLTDFLGSKGTQRMDIMKLYVESEQPITELMFQKPAGKGSGLAWDITKTPAEQGVKTLFEKLGIGDFTKEGGLDIWLRDPSGRSAMERMWEKPQPQIKLVPRTYGKQIPVEEVYYRYPYQKLEIVSPIIIPAKRDLTPDVIIGSKVFLKQFPDRQIKIDSGTALEPRIDLDLRQIPKRVPLTKIIPIVSPRLISEPAIESILIPQAKVKPMLQPRLKIQPKLEMMLKSKLITTLKISPRINYLMEEISPPPRTIISPEDIILTPKKLDRLLGFEKKKTKETKKAYDVVPKATLENIMITTMLYGKAEHPKATKKVKKEFKELFFRDPRGLVAGRFPTKKMRKEPKKVKSKIAKLLGLED
jgi:hypothetical protein